MKKYLFQFIIAVATVLALSPVYAVVAVDGLSDVPGVQTAVYEKIHIHSPACQHGVASNKNFDLTDKVIFASALTKRRQTVAGAVVGGYVSVDKVTDNRAACSECHHPPTPG